MTILERLAALPEVSPQTIRRNFTLDEFKFEILDRLNGEPNLDNAINLFNQLDKYMETQPIYNVISERLALKMLYLNEVYDVDIDLLNAMLNIDSLIKIDMELENILASNSYYTYIKEAFKEHKVNNATTLATIMRYLSTLDLEPLANQLKDQLGDLNKLANKN